MHKYKYKIINKYKKNNFWKNNKYTLTESNIVKKSYSLNNLRLLNLNTFYKKKLINKQCLKDYLGKITEKQFKKNLKTYLNIEQRLDYNLYKSNLVKSIYMSRFCINKGFILINNVSVTKPNIILKKNDIVEINPKYWTIFDTFIKNFIKFSEKNNKYINYKTISNLEVDYATYSFIFLNNFNNCILNNNNKLKHQKNLKLNKIFLKKIKYLKKYNKIIYFDDIYLQFIKRYYK